MFIQKIKKDSESYIIGVDYSALLATGEILDLPSSSVIAERDGADATTEIMETGSLLLVDDVKLTCRIKDGAGVYTIHFEAHTTDSNIYTEEVIVRVAADGITPPVIEPPTDGAAIKVLYEAEPDTNAFSDAEKAKLASMDANASDDQTGAEIKVLYEAEPDTNAYDDAAVTKLSLIEDSATADQTGAEIKVAYEAELDTNAFTDAAVAKLGLIEAQATADQTGAEIKVLYEAELDTNAFTDSIKANVGLNDTHRGTTTGNPHSVTLEEARTADNALGGDVDVNNNDLLNVKELTFQGGQAISWNANDDTLNIPTGLGPVLQVGQEVLIKVYNDTLDTIPNGSAVYPTGGYLGYPTLALAITDSFETIDKGYGVATMAIPPSSYGFVCRDGKVHNLNTSAFTAGDKLWISSDTAGAITNIKPHFPNFAIQIGICWGVGTTDGTMLVKGSDSAEDTVHNFWNGVFREAFKFLTSSDGANVIGALSPANGHPNMTMMFSDGFTTIDTTPAAQVSLTPGTDTVPQVNYVYIPQSTKVLTVSTSDWPTTVEHIRVAEVLLQSAATTLSLGALRNQNWNDHVQDTVTNQGHLSHIGARIRREPAKWDTGVEGSVTLVQGVPDEVYFATTAGKVCQMHAHTFIATDSQLGGDIHVANDSISPYKNISDIGVQTLTSAGLSMSNTCFSFVFWGVANQSNSPSHIMMNLPTDTYAFTTPDAAVHDASNYSVYTIPKSFEGVGFLIARATFSYKTGQWGLIDVEDLRGRIPNSTAGGGGGGTGVTSLLGLSDTPSSYTGFEGRPLLVNSTATAVEFNLTPLMLPELTTTERDAYATPKNGMMIFNTTTGVFNFYRSGAWTTTLA